MPAVTHPNAALIDRFYQAFARRDAATMAACYHADVVFSDPVFPELRGPELGREWLANARRLLHKHAALELHRRRRRR